VARFCNYLLFVFLLLSGSGSICHAQDRFAEIEKKLQSISQEATGLNERVELSVNDVSIQEFIRGIALSNNLNVNVDPELKVRIFNNFSNVTVKDVFLFLCKKYDLDIVFIGSIMSFVQYKPPAPPPPAYVPKPINITFNRTSQTLSFDLSSDSLYLVAKEITKQSQKNIILVPELKNKLVTGFIQEMPLKAALEKLAISNDFKASSSDENVFIFEQKDKEEPVERGRKPGDKARGNYTIPQGMILNVEGGLITVDAVAVPISEILSVVSKELKVNYFQFSELKGTSSLNVRNAGFEEFLKLLLNGTDFTFKKDGEIYLIGDRNLEGLRSTRVVQLKYRTVDKVVDFIPTDIKKGVDIKSFPDLNSLILSGSQPRILEIEGFLRDIDKMVPVILIDVMIAEVRNSKTLSTAIEAGIGTEPLQQDSRNLIYPGVDVSLGATSINNLINGINGFGSLNLGKVTPNFYLKLRALESQGILKFRSTPQLATLNAHEANMSVGRTEYYKEQQNVILGSQITTVSQQFQYKPLTANMSITLTPVVSGDDQITLNIDVVQNTFTERVDQTGPFGTINRTFKSMVRVKNEEMVILGGLEENTLNDSGSGVPFLSRIPVIKWLFSSRTRVDSKNKLTIFIKPTVIY
jgi:type IV pilus assembly protein PilQ